MSSADAWPTRFEQTIPYDVPSSLDDLAGPRTGVVELGGHIDTSPHPMYDLDDSDQVWALYTRVVRDGTLRDQRAFLDRDLLLELWPSLLLPVRCRSRWETRFPELAARSALAP